MIVSKPPDIIFLNVQARQNTEPYFKLFDIDKLRL